MSAVIRAAEFAGKAHAGQKRKYTGEPYIEHPRAVAALVSMAAHTDDMLCAAWLHDVVEDCGIPLDQIERLFGHRVAVLVEALTDVSKPSDGNRAFRKALDRIHLAKAPADAKTVKLADMIDNCRSIVQFDPKFARVYLAEKASLLPFLKEGDPLLYAMAHDIWPAAS